MYIGIDCGTQGTKAIIWDRNQGVLGRAYKSYDIIQDGQGTQEQHPHWWFDACKAVIRSALQDARVDGQQIKALSISGQQHGLVVLDQQSRVIRPAKLWCDTSTTQSLQKFEKQLLPKTFVELIGIHVPVAFTIAKLAWLKDNEPKNFANIAKIMLPHDYLNFCFTGNYFSEAGDASGTGYFNTRTLTWSDEILEKLEMPSDFKLPKLIKSQQPHGKIKTDLAKKLGLNSELIVASGGGDNMMAAIGTANVEPGTLTISLGTSGTAYTYSSKQIESSSFADINAFCSSNNGYLPLVSTMNVTSATTAINTLLKEDLASFEANLAKTPTGSKGLQIFPYFIGARLPNLPAAKGSITGINDQNLTAACLQRATVEAICFNLATGIKLMQQSGMVFSKVAVIGGGANSSCWRQIIADICNLSLVSPLEAEVGALGAAIQACWCYLHGENQDSELSSLCHQSIQYDDNKSAFPVQKNVEQYQALYLDYQRQLAKIYAP